MTTAFIINLEHHRQRREVALRRFQSMDLQLSIHTAVNGRSHPDANDHQPLTPGEFGCYRSHLQVLEHIASVYTTDYVLILEDDAVPCEDFDQFLQQALLEAHARGAGLCQLGWLPREEDLRVDRLLYERLAASKPLRRTLHAVGKAPDKQPPLLTERRPSWGSHCYLVARDYAPTVIKLLRRSYLAPLDYYFGALATLQPGRVLRARFPLAGQDWDYGSSVHASRSRFQHAQISVRGHVLKQSFSRFDPEGREI